MVLNNFWSNTIFGEENIIITKSLCYSLVRDKIFNFYNVPYL